MRKLAEVGPLTRDGAGWGAKGAFNSGFCEAIDDLFNLPEDQKRLWVAAWDSHKEGSVECKATDIGLFVIVGGRRTEVTAHIARIIGDISEGTVFYVTATPEQLPETVEGEWVKGPPVAKGKHDLQMKDGKMRQSDVCNPGGWHWPDVVYHYKHPAAPTIPPPPPLPKKDPVHKCSGNPQPATPEWRKDWSGAAPGKGWAIGKSPEWFLVTYCPVCGELLPTEGK